MVNFKPYIVSLLFLGLIVVAASGFWYGLLYANEPTQIDDKMQNVFDSINPIETSLEDSIEDSASVNNAFTNSTVTTGNSDTGIISIVMGGAWKTIVSAPKAIFNSVGALFGYVLDDEILTVVFGVIGAILGLIIILAVWKLWTTGESG
jgi:hypothetical protein